MLAVVVILITNGNVLNTKTERRKGMERKIQKTKMNHETLQNGQWERPHWQMDLIALSFCLLLYKHQRGLLFPSSFCQFFLTKVLRLSFVINRHRPFLRSSTPFHLSHVSLHNPRNQLNTQLFIISPLLVAFSFLALLSIPHAKCFRT